MSQSDAGHHDAQDRFIELWGKMGSNWGIPRTMAEVHALLFITAEPMSTDDVMLRLHISRGNASTTLRTLVDWGIVSRVHQRGDRRDYYLADQDVWRLFSTVVRERKRREIDPLLAALADCRREATGGRRRVDAATTAIAAHNDRIDQLLDLIRTLDVLATRFTGPSGEGLRAAATLLSKVR